MKKYLYLILVLAFICSCKRNTPTTKKSAAIEKSGSTKMAIPSIKFNNPILKQYQAFVNSLDTNDMATSTMAAEKFQVLFKGQNQNTCDTAFTIFDKYYEHVTNVLDDRHHKDTVDYDRYLVYEDSSRHMPEKVKQYTDKLAANGFGTTVSEGSTYVTEDRDFVAKWFYSYVSPAMKDYLIQLNKESKVIIMDDASILINSNELIDRAVWWENFAKQYPNFILHKQAKNNFLETFETLLEGSENTQVLDIESHQLSSYFEDAYKYVESKYPSSETAKKITPYYKFLLQGKKASADSLLKVYLKNR